MPQTTVTSSFNRYKAQEAAGGRRVVLDEFVFANIPDLDISQLPQDTEGLPDAKYIVYRQPVDKGGMVNADTVVYTVTLPTTAGNFTFNWMALINSESQTPAVITYLHPQQKIKNTDGVQGNVLNYSEYMRYTGASTLTGITTPSSTWQIDFTARLHGMDEATRKAAFDIYGNALFFGDAFKVTATTHGNAELAPGTAYLRGLRTELDAVATLTFETGKEQVISLDSALTGSLTGENQTTFTLINRETTDYTDSLGFRHYVEPIARIAPDGTITDLRNTGNAIHERLDGDFLARAANLKEIADKGAGAQQEARNNLNLGNSATRNVGTTADTVAAGDDGRITGAMQKDRNGADIPDKAAFRKALELGALAGSDGIDALMKDQNGADIPDKPLFIRQVGLQDTVDRASHVNAGDGNLYGTVWGGWLTDYISRNIPSMPNLSPYATTNWVNTYFADKSTASRSGNGWFKDASTGLMIQWGTTGGGTGTSNVSLPVPFPNATLWVLGWVAGALNYGNDDWSNSAGIIDSRTIRVTVDHGWGTAWIAIGY
ncbi:phage tail protein [Salmonella enterica subsp. enterica serovar Braenderup]